MVQEFVVKKEVKVNLEKYYMLRGIKNDCGRKTVEIEQFFYKEPTDEEIAIFLHENRIDFASVSVNYRLIESDFPF